MGYISASFDAKSMSGFLRGRFSQKVDTNKPAQVIRVGNTDLSHLTGQSLREIRHILDQHRTELKNHGVPEGWETKPFFNGVYDDTLWVRKKPGAKRVLAIMSGTKSTHAAYTHVLEELADLVNADIVSMELPDPGNNIGLPDMFYEAIERFCFEAGSPLFGPDFYNKDVIPITHSASGLSFIANLLDPEKAEFARDRGFNSFHMTPYFDNSGVPKLFSSKTLRQIYEGYATYLKDMPVGSGRLDRLYTQYYWNRGWPIAYGSHGDVIHGQALELSHWGLDVIAALKEIPSDHPIHDLRQLIITGDRDLAACAKTAAYASDLMRDSSHIGSSADHTPLLEDPDYFINLISGRILEPSSPNAQPINHNRSGSQTNRSANKPSQGSSPVTMDALDNALA